MCQMGSVAHLLLLNVDKFLSIRIPLRYQVFVTRRRVSIVTVACWTALFIISVISYTVFLQFRDPQNPSCVAVEFKPGAYYAFLTILAYVAPTIYSFAISAYIFVIAQASSRRLGSISERQRRMLMQRIFFVFSSTMWTFITCLPYRIGFALYIFCIQRHIASLNQTENANATLPAETLIPSDNMPACGNFTISHHKPPGLQISFSWNLLIVRITAADRGKGQNHLALYANSDCALYGIDPDACVGKVGLVAITYMFKLLQVGTVGNPIITIITQRQYRGRVIAAWRAVAKALHMPQWCYSEERREIITEARSTRLGSLNESQAFQIL
uniref:G-protein coupled receptors family 1 profile domain-containing protein n=2 Tax=Plectus sambesii TaxID=2011161 RepID=A0A914XKH2_9BILA